MTQGSGDSQSGDAGSDSSLAIAEEHAAIAIDALACEMVRAVARGAENAARVAQALQETYRRLSHDGVRLNAPIFAGIEDAHSRLSAAQDHPQDVELRRILQLSLRLSAERIAQDQLARSRASTAEQSLISAIEAYVMARHRFTEERGWSYLDDLKHRARPPSSEMLTRARGESSPKRPKR